MGETYRPKLGAAALAGPLLLVLGVTTIGSGALGTRASADFRALSAEPHTPTAAVQPGAQRLDGIAAVVGGLAPGAGVISIFRSDVELRARMAVLGQATLRDALGALPDALLRASLDELVGEALIAVEAARLNLERPSAQELVEERARLLGGRGDAGSTRELLAALGVGERELADWIARRAVVNGFLQANLEGTLEISNDELVKAFESEQHPFEGHTLDEVRERFSAWLAQQRLQGAVERWVQSLAQRTPHRLLVVY
jgi:hypothetical protein